MSWLSTGGTNCIGDLTLGRVWRIGNVLMSPGHVPGRTDSEWGRKQFRSPALVPSGDVSPPQLLLDPGDSGHHSSPSIGRRFVGSKEACAIEVDHVRWVLGDPDFGLPGDAWQAFGKSPAIHECRYID